MDHLGAVEERIVTDRIRKKLEEVNSAAQEQLASVQDHVNFTLQVPFQNFFLNFGMQVCIKALQFVDIAVLSVASSV